MSSIYELKPAAAAVYVRYSSIFLADRMRKSEKTPLARKLKEGRKVWLVVAFIPRKAAAVWECTILAEHFAMVRTDSQDRSYVLAYSCKKYYADDYVYSIHLQDYNEARGVSYNAHRLFMSARKAHRYARLIREGKCLQLPS